MFRRYEVVFVFANGIETYKKFFKFPKADRCAASINRGRIRLGLYEIAHVRQNGHIIYPPRSA